MSKLKIAIVFIFLFSTGNIFSQNCTLSNSYVIDKANMNHDAITKKVQENINTTFTNDFVDKLKAQVNSCQTEVATELNELDRKFSYYSGVKKKFFNFNNFDQQDSTLKALQLSRNETEKNINKNIPQLTYEGLYLVVLKNTSSSTNDTVYANRAKHLLAPVAINNLIATFSKNETAISNYPKFKDIIKSYCSGTFTTDKILLSNKMNVGKDFVYLTVVKLNPQKPDAAYKQNEKTCASSGSDYIVINALSQDYTSLLSSYNLNAEALKEIKSKINKVVTDNISKQNETANSSTNAVITDLQKNLADQDLKIAQQKVIIETNSTSLKDLINKETPEVTFSDINKNQSLKNAIAAVDKRMFEINLKKKAAKEKELKIISTSVTTPLSEEAINKMATEIINQKNYLERSFGNIDNFIELTNIDQNNYKNAKEGDKVSLYRTVNNMWLYLVPGSNNSESKLTIVANFMIDDNIINNSSKPSASFNYNKTTTTPETTNSTSYSSNTIIDIDGNVYHTITIGSQVWMVENFKSTHYRNGDAIPNVTDNLEWSNLTSGAYCNYDNNASKSNTYGRLYNWYTVNDKRNLAPKGYHVATDDDWKVLEKYLGMEVSDANNTGWRGKKEGGQLKESGDQYWVSHSKDVNNSTGFTARPGGYRRYNGTFSFMGNNGSWWCSTEYTSTSSWYRYLNCNGDGVYRTSDTKQNGFSVRCVKDIA